MESRISVPEIASEAQQKQRYERLRAAVSALPGVESVALAKELPLMLGYNETPAQVRDNAPVSSTGLVGHDVTSPSLLFWG